MRSSPVLPADPPGSRPQPRLPLGWICLGLAVLFWLPQLGSAMFDPKEADFVVIGARSLPGVLHVGFKNQSFLWPLLLHFWMRIGGEGEFWTRLLSVLLSSLGVLWSFRLGALLLDRRAGLAAAFLYAVNPSMHWHAREARMYGLLAALTVGAFACALSWERGGRWRDLVGAGLLCLTAAYLHFFGLAVAVAVFGTLVVGGVLRRDVRPRVGLLPVVVGTLLLGAALVPQARRVHAGLVYSGGPNARFGLTGGLGNGLSEFGRELWLCGVGLPSALDAIPAALLLVSLALFVVGLWAIRPPQPGGVPLGWTRAALLSFVGLAMVGFVVMARSTDIRSRYASFLVGPLVVGMALGLRSRWARGRLPRAALAGLLLASTVALITQHLIDRGNLDAVAAWVRAEAGPEDTVVSIPGYAANLVRAKLHRQDVIGERSLAAGLRERGTLGDTIWVVHAEALGGALRPTAIQRDHRLLEQRVGPRTSVTRWSRAAREADRRRDVRDLVARSDALAGPDRVRVLLTGGWSGTDGGQGRGSHALRRAADLVLARGAAREGGHPRGVLSPAGLRRVARGRGWSLSAARRPLRGVIPAVLDLTKRDAATLPQGVPAALARLAERGAPIVRVIPKKGLSAADGVALAEAAVRAGVLVVTVDGLPARVARRLGRGLLLPSLGQFSSAPGPGAPGQAALVVIGPDGVLSADLIGTFTGPSGLPRVAGDGIVRFPPPGELPAPLGEAGTPRPAAWDPARAGRGRALLDLYPDRARAVELLPGGGERVCYPEPGTTVLYDSEAGPDGQGELSQRLLCTARQLDEQWNMVARARHRIGGQTRTCLWEHPFGEQPVRLSFGSVRLGDALQGHIGVSDVAFAHEQAPARFEVRVDGHAVYEGTVGEERGWLPWAADTSRWAGTRHDLEFLVTAEHRRWRHVCFDGELLP